jgi:hypothetical protein
MDYDEFDAEYGRLLDSARSLDRAALSAEVSRLQLLVETVEPPSDQSEARLLLATLQDAVGRDLPPLSEGMTQAVQVHTRARTAEGPADQRIRQLRAGIAEIARIAESADAAERGAIQDLNESLALLVDSLELSGDRSTDPRS